MNSHKTILHLCADIGSDTQPYREAGYNVICVGKNIGVENYHPPENVYGIIANPPCTHFSIARQRAKTPRNLEEGMRLVKECLRIIWECQYKLPEGKLVCPLKFWVIENPATGLLKYFLGKPVYEYSPHEFGAEFRKRTALWGRFDPPKKPLFCNEYGYLEKGKSVDDVITPMNCRTQEERMALRSMCYQGFAKAFFEVNQ